MKAFLLTFNAEALVRILGLMARFTTAPGELTARPGPESTLSMEVGAGWQGLLLFEVVGG